MAKKRNRIKRDDAYERYFCLAVAFWAVHHAEKLHIKQRSVTDILNDYEMGKGGATSALSALARKDNIPTWRQVMDVIDKQRELAAIRKETRIQKDKDETPEDVVAQFNAIVSKHPWLVTDLQLKRRKATPTLFNY